MSEQETITFGRKEIDPSEEAAYRDRIAKARAGGVNALKSNEPVGVVPRPNIPLLQRQASESAPSGLSDSGGVQPRPPGSPLLSPKTQAQLEAMAKVQKIDAEKLEDTVKEQAEKDKSEELLEMFDFNGSNEAERILNNKKRRKDIESRCEPMNFEDLLIRDEVRQRVPIKEGQFEVTYRSLTPEESLFIKQYMAKDQAPSDSYTLEKYSICQLCCALVAINGVEFPDHRTTDGSPDTKLFDIKLKKLLKKSGYILADLGLNYMWFDVRVRKLINPDALGNG